jgi:hypothetical protein
MPATFTLSAECQCCSVALACCWTRPMPPGHLCHQVVHPPPLLVVVVLLSPEHPRPWAQELAFFGAMPSLSRTRSTSCRHRLASKESPHHHTELCTGWPPRSSSSCRHRRSFPHMKAKPMTYHNAKLHELCPFCSACKFPAVAPPPCRRTPQNGPAASKSRTTTCRLCHPLQNLSSFACRLVDVASYSQGLNPTPLLESALCENLK